MMKKQQIQTGKKYTDGKGNVREVIGAGEPYPRQQDNDVVRYKVIKKFRGPNMVGDVYNTTRASFAVWAKGVVED